MEMERDAVVRSAGSLNMETRKPEERSISHMFMCIVYNHTLNREHMKLIEAGYAHAPNF